jgi:hypothetical protein
MIGMKVRKLTQELQTLETLRDVREWADER